MNLYHSPVVFGGPQNFQPLLRGKIGFLGKITKLQGVQDTRSCVFSFKSLASSASAENG